MSSLEAKIVVVGSQGVGKTSLVTRFCKGQFDPSQITSTVGASFLTKRVVDSDSDTVVRLQIWDTAGQERFRSISRLYYRGANACILCYSITDANSFAEMGIWLTELRRNLPADIVLHVVGTKADIVARDPHKREVPFERCIAYVAENLAPGTSSTPPPTAGGLGPGGFIGGASVSGSGGVWAGSGTGSGAAGAMGASYAAFSHGTTSAPPPLLGGEPRSPSSKRSSGFWGQEAGWDACHEISAESGEGVEEVFRVVTRKLVEQNRKMQQALLAATSTPGAMFLPGDGSSNSAGAGADGYGYGGVNNDASARGSFRVGRDRRSWLFPQTFGPEIAVDPNGSGSARDHSQDPSANRRRGCC
ncbi:Ras-like GTP-binding protein [Grosmannia clavigera kw1407]|uniref:Ras-like GTP-binding protein n=1 Tax=Grosmannia clavigera (strain kw1407 / UAMH 11150) TaxID=655863 RepID=F0XI18_GROCL|nr:Ras-like GTP-binding protein [Grosmannia clavigera kw1407]EFX03183.1 Ras-like GTP-binding protein [Grosmannia clavigera kw1407]